jgi:hypothetical protein
LFKLACSRVSTSKKEELALTNSYFAGLLDADGNFDIYILFRPKRNKYEIRVRVRLELQAVDKFLIEGCKTLFGGRISFRALTNA